MAATEEKMEVAVRSETETVGSSEQLEEEEETFFQDIDLLLEYGIPKEDVNLLKKAGINTIKGIQMTIRKRLCEIKGLHEEKIDKIKVVCCTIAASNGFMTGLEVAEQRKQVFKLTTGSSNLDRLLGGGIESMAITEAFGEFRTGKTQLSHTLCVTAQMPGTNGYLGGKVMFIDTEQTFRPDRLRCIADRFNLDQTAVLENILYARAYNSEHQFELLVAAKFHEEAGIFKLLIVDSIMALFRVDYCGRGELADRQQKLGRMMSRLQKISEEFNVAVFVTNQITSDFSGISSPEGQLPKPVGGNVLAHASTTRLALRKVSIGNKRIAKIYDSPDLEESETTFTITSGGIDDPKD
nr:unnamed protein product [Callosobruchus analis]